MQVTVIGCSTTWTDKAVSSYCVNGNMLIDCGEGTLKYYEKCGVVFENINHIFITHIHGDHFLGLGAHISHVLVYESEEQKGRLTIYGPKGLLRALTVLKEEFACPNIKKNVEDYINVIELEPNQILQVDNLEIDTIQLDHGGVVDIAYMFKENGKTIGFSGDCTYDENTKKFVEICDVAFIDCCAEKTTKSHMGAEHLLPLQTAYPQKRLIAVHCTDEFLQKAKTLNIETTKTAKKYNF